MTDHLTANIISAICARNIDLKTETAAFEHWRSCEICLTNLRQAIGRSAPWPSDLPAESPLFAMRFEALWPFWIISTGSKLLALTFSEDEFEEFTDILLTKGYSIEYENPTPFLIKIGNKLREFLENSRPYHISDLNFYLVKSDFSRQVLTWTGLVPFGRVASYGQVAYWMGRPGAARGVGSALHINPLALVIPCHRIIGSDGALVGFGGDLEMKRRLLEMEGSYLQNGISVNRNSLKVNPIIRRQ